MGRWKIGGLVDHNKQVVAPTKPPTLVASFLESTDAKRAVKAMDLAAELIDWASHHSVDFAWEGFPLAADNCPCLACDEGFAYLVELAKQAAQ